MFQGAQDAGFKLESLTPFLCEFRPLRSSHCLHQLFVRNVRSRVAEFYLKTISTCTISQDNRYQIEMVNQKCWSLLAGKPNSRIVGTLGSVGQ